jgi:hypothetical protein
VFGLAALEDALLMLATNALDDCGLAVPDRALKYHGDVVVQCCDGNGLLTCHWNPATPDRTGIPAGVNNPVGQRTADILLRLYRCYPTLNEDGSFPESEGDDASEALAIDADCIYSAITAAICSGELDQYLAGCDALGLVSMTPRKPSGGCAGLEFKLRAQWAPWSP